MKKLHQDNDKRGLRGRAALFAVGGVEESEIGGDVVEDFAWLEETLELDFGTLGRVGSVDNVLLVAEGEVATDSTGSGLRTVGDAGHGTDDLDSILTAQTHDDNRSGHHGVEDEREEGTVNQVGIMLAEDSLVELHELHAGDDQTLVLESGNNLSDERTFDARRLYDYQGLFHIKKGVRLRGYE